MTNNANFYFLKTDPTFNIFLTLDHALTKEECAEVIELGESLEKRRAISGRDHRHDIGRSCSVADIDFTEQSAWIYQRVIDIVSTANTQSFNYDVVNLETIQYTSYEQSGDQYGRHMDLHTRDLPLNRTQKKLGFSIFLDDPESYEGGHLLAWDSENKNQINQPQGAIVIYPSWLVHQITPMEQGRRRSLDGCLHGPMFR
jgi:PKHD-type hydroxylase